MKRITVPRDISRDVQSWLNHMSDGSFIREAMKLLKDRYRTPKEYLIQKPKARKSMFAAWLWTPVSGTRIILDAGHKRLVKRIYVISYWQTKPGYYAIEYRRDNHAREVIELRSTRFQRRT